MRLTIPRRSDFDAQMNQISRVSFQYSCELFLHNTTAFTVDNNAAEIIHSPNRPNQTEESRIKVHFKFIIRTRANLPAKLFYGPTPYFAFFIWLVTKAHILVKRSDLFEIFWT